MSDTAFPEETRRGLAALLDTLIPPSDDGDLPGAGALGVDAYVEERAPELLPLLAQGLAALDAAARERGAERFAELSAEARQALIEGYSREDPGLLPALVFHGYTGYYQQPRVVEALGMEHRPPFPEGYPMEPLDPSTPLLESVRRRGRMFRGV